MKKTIMLVGITSCYSLVSAAQKINASDVPPTVVASFQKNYPGITPQWEYEEGKFDGEFRENGHKIEALFDRKGNMSVNIDAASLPPAAHTYLSKNYKDEKVKKPTKLATAGGEISYAVRIGGKEVLFDSKGGFLRADAVGKIIPVEKD